MSAWLLLGGMAGALLRAFLGQQRTLSRRTALDVLTGGALAVVLPALSGVLGVTLPPTLDRLVYVCAGFVIGGFGNYILVALLWRCGIFREDPRAAKPDGNGGT